MNSLVGYTGFVGSNLLAKGEFQKVYNSKNIQEAFNTKPDLLVYSGIKAEKFLANKMPNEDYQTILEAYDNIKKINPKKLVLISTIDVYKNPTEVNEDTPIETEGLHPYGLNRYHLEKMIEESMSDYLIVRLPSLYGRNLKKNFIYDIINIIPWILKREKLQELANKDNFILNYYEEKENEFYKCKYLNEEERDKLKLYFKEIGFSALNFTDSRAVYQFYNLDFLWTHINIALENNIKKLNIATEPINVQEIYESVSNQQFTNEIVQQPIKYNIKTKYSEIFQGENGYIFNKEFVGEDIKKFIEANQSNLK